MAPINDGTVDELRNLVSSLEKRVHELEAKLEGKSTKPRNLSDQMRMILIGPPGAGELPNSS
jgi:adenylate kinase